MSNLGRTSPGIESQKQSDKETLRTTSVMEDQNLEGVDCVKNTKVAVNNIIEILMSNFDTVLNQEKALRDQCK